MEVHFKTHSGDSHTLNLDQNATIGDARKKILSSKIFNIENQGFKLLYDGEILPDGRSISDLNLQEASSIIIQLEPNEKFTILEVEKEEENYEEEEDYDEEIIVEPDNFDLLVKDLVELGYAKDLCEAALRIVRFNVEEAANLLVTENNQDVVFIENEKRRQNELKNKKKRKNERKQKKTKIIEQNGTFIIQQESEDYDSYDDDEEEEVITKRSILGPYREVYEHYNKEEKKAIDNLSKKLGINTKQIIQIFEACERNAEATEAVLLESKNQK